VTKTTTPNPTVTAVRLDELWTLRGPVVMGIVNCTPDSFSDGGRFLDVDKAVDEAVRQLGAGARIIDIGGESTRPGARAVDADEECRRIVPVIAELRRRQPSVALSADTTKTEVARAALDAGADIINDVSGGAESGMLEIVAERRAAVVLMHRRGTPKTMQSNTDYTDTVAEVHAYLAERAASAKRAGIDPERIWLDPGIGFGKDDPGNLALLAAVPQLAALGHPVVVGPSRKSFIGRLTGAPVDDRLAGTLASLIPSVGLDRVVVRVHDPGPTIQFLELARLVRESAA
jgi:dihydropteroate synthase